MAEDTFQGARILVVEDDEDIRELLNYNLTRAGFEVSAFEKGEPALERAVADPPRLVLLDLMLPGMDGFEVCRRLKESEQTRDAVIIMLTARGEEADIVKGLEAGADDYITKPFSPKVLLARVRAALRRSGAGLQAAAETVRDAAGILINEERHTVSVQGKPVSLTATEYRILSYLTRRPGWVFTRSQIIDAARGDDASVTDRSVDVHITALRKKLGDAGEFIETVRGIGYRFRDG